MTPSRHIYQKISHQQRVTAIYLRVVHKVSISEIMARTGLKYNTIRNFIRTYKKSGLTNKRIRPVQQGARKMTISPQNPSTIELRPSAQSFGGSRSINGVLESQDCLESSEIVQTANAKADQDPAGEDQACSISQRARPPPKRSLLQIVRLNPPEGFSVGEIGSDLLTLELPGGPSSLQDKVDSSLVEIVNSHIELCENIKEAQVSVFPGPLASLNEVMDLQAHVGRPLCDIQSWRPLLPLPSQGKIS